MYTIISLLLVIFISSTALGTGPDLVEMMERKRDKPLPAIPLTEENAKLLEIIRIRKTISLSAFEEELAQLDKDLISEQAYNRALQVIFEKKEKQRFIPFSKDDEKYAFAQQSKPMQRLVNRLKHIFLPHIYEDGKDPRRGTQAEFTKALVTRLGLVNESDARARFSLYPRTRDLMQKGQFGHLYFRQRKTPFAKMTGAVGHCLVDVGKTVLSMYEVVAVTKKFVAAVPVGVLVLSSEGGIHATSHHRHVSHVQRAIEIISAIPAFPWVALKAQRANRLLSKLQNHHNITKEDQIVTFREEETRRDDDDKATPDEIFLDLINDRKRMSLQEFELRMRKFAADEKLINGLSKTAFVVGLEGLSFSTKQNYRRKARFSRSAKKLFGVTRLFRDLYNSIKHDLIGHAREKHPGRGTLNQNLEIILKEIGEKGEFPLSSNVRSLMSKRLPFTIVPELARERDSLALKAASDAGGLLTIAVSISSLVALAILGGPLGIATLTINVVTTNIIRDFQKISRFGNTAALIPFLQSNIKESHSKRVQLIENYVVSCEKRKSVIGTRIRRASLFASESCPKIRVTPRVLTNKRRASFDQHLDMKELSLPNTKPWIAPRDLKLVFVR